MEAVMEVYLDHAATTPCTEEVITAVSDAMRRTYGNPSSRHSKGIEADQVFSDARKEIAATLHCSEKEIYFTSGGTESDNWALAEGAKTNRRTGMHLITSAIEHEAVLEPMKRLENEGYKVTYLKPQKNGRISLEELREALTPDTALVSIMYVNNELGTLQPIAEAARLVKQLCPRALFHTDAVQAYGKYDIRPAKMGIDLLSASGHKIHGPKGIGFLYAAEGCRLQPMILGGGQQRGMRSGTHPVPGAAGMAKAARQCFTDLNGHMEYMKELKKQMLEGLSAIDNVVIHSPLEDGFAPYIVSAAFPGVRSEVLLNALNDRGIYASAGSACSSNRTLPVSPVLQAVGMDQRTAESTLRFSFSRMTTPEEIDAALKALGELVPMLRRYTRR